MKVINRTETFVEIDGVEYEVRLEPDHHDVIHRKLEDGRMVIGYLMNDENCANPLEDCDGMGKIIKHRSQADADETSQILARDHMVVPLSKFEHGGVIWGVMGSLDHTPDFRWDGTRYAGRWEPDESCIEHIKSSAIKHAMPDGVTVEYKSKKEADGTIKDGNLNIITLTMPDGWTKGGYSSFTSAYQAAARKLKVKITPDIRKAGERKAAIDCAMSACSEFTKWCNGDCYGVVVVECNADGSMVDSDECWGYIGSDYAKKTLKEQVEGMK